MNMTVWIVTRNGKIDAVFDNEISALHHQEMLTKKWAISQVIEMEVNSI